MKITLMRVTTILVLVLLVVLFTWVARHTYWYQQFVPQPWKGEAARNPAYAAQRLTEALGARTVRDGLPAAPLPDSVIVLSAWNWGLSSARRERLQRWVEAGGRLVVDGSLITGADDFERWSGIERRVAAASEVQPDEPADCHSLRGAGVRAWQLCGVEARSSLHTRGPQAWQLGDEHGAHIVRVVRGAGSVTFVDSARPFAGHELFAGDHATLFVLSTQLRRGDTVYFVSEREAASLLALAWRHGAPVLVLLLLLAGAWIWRSAVRFGPLIPQPDSARRSLAEQIRGTGQFALRFGNGAGLQAAAVRALAEAARRRIAGYDRLAIAQRAEALAPVTGLAAGELADAMTPSEQRRSNELRSVLSLLETARRRLLIANQRPKNGS